MALSKSLKRYMPVLEWLPKYRRQMLWYDGMAAVVVTLLLVPQALAYALLAGMPPETGLYASMLPLVAYTIFGTSRSLAVGPFAVVSMMTAAAVGQVAAQGEMGYVTAAVALAGLSGVILIIMGLLRLGFLVNFLSHPVITGFISASGILIGASQLEHLLGIQTQGQTLPAIGYSLWKNYANLHALTVLVGASTLILLLALRRYLKAALLALRLPALSADLVSKSGPVIGVAIMTMVSAHWRLDQQGVAVVGDIPSALPALAWPELTWSLLSSLWVPALIISIIGFVESVSMAQTLAARRRERIEPDQELIGLGSANIASALSGSFPVAASLSRSVVNYEAGALTPAAGFLTAIGIAIAGLYLSSALYYLPLAVLAATIIIAVLSLIQMKSFGPTWRYSRNDGTTMLVAFIFTLLAGVTVGLLAGVGLSLLLYLYRTSRPHSALVGRVPGSEHFRNIHRHNVETDPSVVILRVDESLYFANARFLEDTVARVVAEHQLLRHLVLLCPAVNHIDASALESLEAIQERLNESGGIKLHLAEVKGPVMDRLRDTSFLAQLNGTVFLSAYEAWLKLRIGG